MISLFRQQPKAVSMIFMLELWERFGFYTVQGILILYFIRQLGFSDESAYFAFGAFSAVIYGLVAFGGYLGDHVLGPKRTLVLGLVVLALGYFFLAIATISTVFYALSTICLGNGIFKANPSNILARCYNEKDPRLHSGFTLYYMAVNLGSIFSLFVGPYLSSHYGYFYAYMMSVIGIIFALLNYSLRHHLIKHVATEVDKKNIAWFTWVFLFILMILIILGSAYLLQHTQFARIAVWVITFAALSIYFRSMQSETVVVRRQMLLVLFLLVEAVVFFTLYQQMPTSITLFAVNNVYPTLLGVSIDPQSFQVLNPIWIIFISPILAKLYIECRERNIVLPMPYKFAVGMGLCGLSFIIMFLSRFFHDGSGLVSSGWLIGSYAFQAISELLIGALGLAMIAELVPTHMTGFVMGIWFLTSSISGFTGAKVAALTALPDNIQPGVESLMIYTRVFAQIGVVTLIISVVLWFVAPKLTNLLKSD